MKSFWSYIKRVTGKVKSSLVPDLQTSGPSGNIISVSDDRDKADVLNTFFAEQTRLHDTPSTFPDLSGLYDDASVADALSITPAEVFDVLTHLKPGKAPGLDEIPPQLLRLCAPGIRIASSLSELFNRSFNDCSVPSAWNEALVVPVHKGGTRSDPSNYQPIALLSIVCKVMEKLLHCHLNAFLEPGLSMRQSGFKKKDGTAVIFLHPYLLATEIW